MSSLGYRVRAMREKLNLTQSQVSEITKISRSNIGKIENDQIVPNCNAILAFARLFNVSTDYLIKGDDETDSDMNDIGSRIKLRRNQLGLTVEKLGELTGLEDKVINDLENNRYLPFIFVLTPLSKVLEVSINWLVYGNDYNKEIVLSQHDLDLLPLSHAEKYALKEFRKLSDKDQNEVVSFMRLKNKNP